MITQIVWWSPDMIRAVYHLNIISPHRQSMKITIASPDRESACHILDS